MRKIYMHASTGYCGTSLDQMVEVPDDTTDEELNDWAWEEAVQNAARYGYEEHEDWCECEACEACEENGGSEYSNDQIDSCWEEYDEEKHGAKCF